MLPSKCTFAYCPMRIMDSFTILKYYKCVDIIDRYPQLRSPVITHLAPTEIRTLLPCMCMIVSQSNYLALEI